MVRIPSTALRLAEYFGMTAGFWMNLQLRWDLYQAQQNEKRVLDTIQPLTTSNKRSRDFQHPA